MENFIETYDNSVSQELCNELIEWFEVCSDKNFTDHNLPFGEGKTKPSWRTDESIISPFPPTVSSFSLSDKVCDAFWNVLNKCYYEYVTKYDMNDFPLSCYCFKLHKVKEGQGYHVWHHESGMVQSSLHRVLAWMTYLKVPEEGGETEFLYQSKRIKPHTR